MKCPNCGAEVQGQVCEYCGSKMPQEPSTVNITYNYYGGPMPQNHNEAENNFGKYPMNGNPTASYKSSRKKTWLWVLGWICIFPLPLTILLLRKKNMKPVIKFGIIAIAWILFFVIGLSGNSETDVPQTDNPSSNEEDISNTPDETTSETETLETTLNNYIADIVNKYNAQATEQLVFVEDFTPSNEESGHYRTEFRLNAYDDAVGKSYLLGGKVVDIIATQTIFGEINCRVYTNDTSLDQVIALLQGFSPILDEALTAVELQETINEVSTLKTANGYYYGELGIALFGDDSKGYELTLKRE